MRNRPREPTLAPVATQRTTVDRADLSLARVVRETIAGSSWNQARNLCRTGRVTIDGQTAVDPELRLRTGCVIEIDPVGRKLQKGALHEARVIHVDNDLVVVDKPAGVLSVPFTVGDRDTLIDLTRAALRKRSSARFDPELGIVHRIDLDTTGLLVFTRNLSAKRALQTQFRAHRVFRRYLALVHGELRERSYDSLLIRNRGDGLRGSYGKFRAPKGPPPADAQRAITHTKLREPLRGASLVECALETGRQHQIRIHLSEAGHPLLGERVYIRDYLGSLLPAPRPMLHARELGFVHPRTEREVRFVIEPPDDFKAVLERLRR